MKALTLTQPWATLVAVGAKRIETRSWRGWYRGQIAIHAAKSWPKWAREFSQEPECWEVLRKYILPWRCSRYPLGAVVATCRIVDYLRTEDLELAALTGQRVLSKQERGFGDYSEGRYAWLLDDIEILPEPIPARGALGLWEWKPEARP
jgi:hypothetical protein